MEMLKNISKKTFISFIIITLITNVIINTSGCSITNYTDNIEHYVADYQSDEWNLVLVNKWNPIPDNYTFNLVEFSDNNAVDERIYPELQKMFNDMKADGLYPCISSSYRSTDTQQQYLDEKIAEYKLSGYSYKKAKRLAERWVALPNTSEHEIGIAVDITTTDRNVQDASYIWNWLRKNAYKYGFILRYPKDKEDITGVMFEAWHYRYVGKEVAKEIFEKNICLEEYLSNQSEQNDNN